MFGNHGSNPDDLPDDYAIVGSEEFVALCAKVAESLKTLPTEHHQMVCDLLTRLERRYTDIIPQSEVIAALPAPLREMAHIYAHYLGHLFFEAGREFRKTEDSPVSFEDLTIDDLLGGDKPNATD